MTWQDYVISSAQIGFIIALVPTIRSKDKPPKATSLMTVALLSVITFCFFTLHLYYSALTALAIAITWAVIAVQTLRMERKR